MSRIFANGLTGLTSQAKSIMLSCHLQARDGFKYMRRTRRADQMPKEAQEC
jgi:hypothetical protein